MSKADPSSPKRERNRTIKWVITIFLVTIVVSGMISLISDEVMARSGIVVAFIILLMIILVGVVFDILGMAVATADEKPFHSMAARKVPGAQEAIALLRNAERVSSICNDVVGDICGVVAGSASATVAVQLIQKFSFSWPALISLILSALVAGLTVGGKAIGKTIAVHSCIQIVHFAGKFIYYLRNLKMLFRCKQKR